MLFFFPDFMNEYFGIRNFKFENRQIEKNTEQTIVITLSRINNANPKININAKKCDIELKNHPKSDITSSNTHNKIINILRQLNNYESGT